jgi:hypothetical protein
MRVAQAPSHHPGVRRSRSGGDGRGHPGDRPRLAGALRRLLAI